MLTAIVFLPLLAAVALAGARRASDRLVRWTWLATTVVDLALVIAVWVGHDRGAGFGGRFAAEERYRWIPSLGVSYHVGVDGVSLPLVAVTGVLFLACAGYSWHQQDRLRPFAALFLFLQSVSLGLFVALDLVLFFVFFDLSIVGKNGTVIVWWSAGPLTWTLAAQSWRPGALAAITCGPGSTGTAVDQAGSSSTSPSRRTDSPGIRATAARSFASRPAKSASGGNRLTFRRRSSNARETGAWHLGDQ